MTAQEFNDQFDVLYNNITSNQAPGLDEYEKSVFLTKAQDEIIKNYFLRQSNPKQAGFDNNQKRQIDFSNLLVNEVLTTNTKKFVSQTNAVSVNLNDLVGDLLLIINERIDVIRNTKNISLVIKSISFDEYDRLMQKPFKYPTYNQAWRLMVNNKISDIIIGPSDTVTANNYHIRYIRKPKPIIVDLLADVTIDGYSAPIDVDNPCELDEILHQEILQRAVELAKISWANGNDNTQMLIQTGARSE